MVIPCDLATFVDQLGDVDGDPLRLGDVDLIERDDDGEAELTDLTREEEVAIEVDRIDDDEDDVGIPVGGVALEQDFEGDLFVGGADGEGIRAGEIEDRDTAAVAEGESALDTLDGDAGEVPDALPKSGERVEEGGLAGVRIADDGDAQGPIVAEARRRCRCVHVRGRWRPAAGR